VGRWVSTDPAEQYHDLYRYGGSNPINRFDPDGNQDEYFQMAISMPRSLSGIMSWLVPKHEQDAIVEFGEGVMIGSMAVSGTVLAAPVVVKGAPVVVATCKTATTIAKTHPEVIYTTGKIAIEGAEAVTAYSVDGPPSTGSIGSHYGFFASVLMRARDFIFGGAE
ncbi:hypothetical protein QA601_18690, partial [Chitinispirillales bacterium ANBcel5]|uniref:hypothetical protein n=1 Tax=Cellulosispirillum alkaliphilum TaxID=3039283 RepID=UPI002A4FCCDA|nr:hypothetical protein [Chitinispirillales bacterium ANBcel5]